MAELDGNSQDLDPAAGLRVLTVPAPGRLVESTNLATDPDGTIRIADGEAEAEAVYQFNDISAAALYDILVDAATDTMTSENPPQAPKSWGAVFGNHQVSDVFVQVATSADGVAWSEYLPDNRSAATLMGSNVNGLPPRVMVLGPTASNYSWAQAADGGLVSGPLPHWLGRSGPGDALRLIQALQTGAFVTDSSLDENLLHKGAERLTWGLYLYQAEVATNPRAEFDWSRLEFLGGTAYPDAYYGNGDSLGNNEYFSLNAGGNGEKAAVWKFIFCSAVPPAETKGFRARWFRSSHGHANTGAGRPFVMRGFDPIRDYNDAVLTPKYTEAFDYADDAAAVAAGWTFDVTQGNGGTLGLSADYHVRGALGKSLKFNPVKGTLRKYVVATGPMFNITAGLLTALQWDQKTVSNAPDTGYGIPVIHHYQLFDMTLEFYKSDGTTRLDAMKLTRERSEFSDHETNGRTNYILQEAPYEAAKARIVASGEINNAGGCPAALAASFYLDAIRVDQFSVDSTALRPVPQRALPRLEFPGREVTIRQVEPQPYVRVKVTLERWDATHGDPALRRASLLYLP